MKTFLYYLERAWLLAAVSALVLAAYNYITTGLFNQEVYFPIFCAGFCVLIHRNIRGQRRFNERMHEKMNENNMP